MENVLVSERIVKRKTYPVLVSQSIRKLRMECLIKGLSISLAALVKKFIDMKSHGQHITGYYWSSEDSNKTCSVNFRNGKVYYKKMS